MQLISMYSPSLMFFFTFLQILFYEPIACYLPDTEAAPQGIIFSPPSQRVASLMLSLKSLEQLHIGYLPCLPREICSGEESVPHCSNWDSLGFCSFFFLLQEKRRKNSYLCKLGHEPFNLGSIHENIQDLLKRSQFFWKE